MIAWLDDARHDLRLGCRNLVRSAGVPVVAVLVLAAGIGLAVAIFSIADTTLRRPLPILDEDRVVVLWGEAAGSMRTLPLTLQHFDRYRHEARALQDVAGTVSVDSWAQAVRDGDRTFRANLSPVTGNFFAVLGAQAILGRTLRPEDDRAGAEPVAVVSYSLWRTKFASSPAVLGRRIALQNSRVFTVVGVAPPGLEYPNGTEAWIPFVAFSVPEVMPLGRLASGVSATDAAAELRASFEREPARGGWTRLRGTARPLRSLIVGDVAPALLLLTAAASLLLLTACLNVSGLLLVRGSARRHEMAVRRALGAGRARIVRQLIVESAPIALAAGVLGAWLAVQLIHAVIVLAPANLPRLEDVRLHRLPLGLAMLVSCAAALGSALVPALSLSGGVVTTLRESGRGITGPRSRFRAHRAMVVFQVSVAVVVLFTAGLLGRTLQQLHRIDTGLATDHIAILELSWPEKKFGTPARVAAFYDQLLSRLQVLPDIASAAAVNVVPFTGATAGWDGGFVAEGQPGKTQVFNLAVGSAACFDTLGIRLRKGRTFSDADRDGSPAVAIVSERAAQLLWPGQDALGKRLRIAGATGEWRTVVGVAPETRYRAIREPAPTVYLPVRQFPEVFPLVMTVAVRTRGTPDAAMVSIREAVRDTDSDVSVLDISGMSDLVAGELATPRLSAVLVGVFGAGAVLLAAVGLYAVLAGVVKERRRELAIRHAVGATPRHLRGIVLRQGLAMCAAGVSAGLAVSFGTARFLDSVLYGVGTNDGRTIAAVVALLAGIAIPACYLPARQATRADTMEVLRQD